MKLGFEEFSGVKCWLSASKKGDNPWRGEANVRIKVGAEYGQKTISAPEAFRTGEEAMDGARQMLQALCLSGALRNMLPNAYEVIEGENGSKPANAGWSPGKPGTKTMRLMFVMLLMVSGYAFAGCDSIGDSDQRAYCKAKEGLGNCGSINDRDLRYACNAQTNGGSCNSIDDRDQRYLCNARTNRGSCGSIDDRDLRYACNAETNGGSCNSIDDRDQRYLCNARTNNGSCGSINDRDLRAQCDALKH
ncbi:hypothetical protein [Pseudomonas orientalis]|uniref:hypothetical protein n=1 Tax=Pseudomonas orientalis TaxID=76758 RepID=UPI003D6D1E44